MREKERRGVEGRGDKIEEERLEKRKEEEGR